MQIKRFSAATSKEVLALIKQEFGSDAVILDTVEEDGLITMTAALERVPVAKAPARGNDDGALISAPAAPATDNADSQGGTAQALHTSPLPSAATQEAPQHIPTQPSQKAEPFAPDMAHNLSRAYAAASSLAGNAALPPGWQQWHEEWSSIKHHIMALMKPAMRLDRLPPRQRLAIEFLQREGVEDTAVMQLHGRLEGDPSASILQPLASLVPVRPWGDEYWPQRIQLIAGPFGAGKTSVAIRLALNLVRQSPGLRICLVNADATRGNGRLLLRHYCDLSEMAYKEASTTLELVASLNSALREGYDRVIVDLPGLSRGRYLKSLLSDAGLGALAGSGRDELAVHLCLPPHYGTLQLRGILERYRCEQAGSLVWTKLDEAEHYGQIVNVGVQTGLPVSALSFGPGLRNSLAPVKETMLWRLLFKRELPIGA